MTREYLKSVLFYDPDTGKFVWLVRLSHFICAGDEAGSLTRTGYQKISIGKRTFQSHRLAWLYMTGAWPTEYIDHIDGDPLNNRWKNLRMASNSQNQANSKKRAGCSSHLKGVTYIPQNGRWQAAIKKDGHNYYLGQHLTQELAHAAYCGAAKILFGKFARAA